MNKKNAGSIESAFLNCIRLIELICLCILVS